MTQASQNSAIWNDDTTTASSDFKDQSALHPRVEINLGTICNNYRSLASYTSKAETCGVVKADAYGHGAEQVGAALAKSGCKTFFVAYTHEGIALRKAIGPEPDIFIFNGMQPSETDIFISHRLKPICNTLAEAKHLLSTDLTSGFALQFDTGMNRIGLRMEQLSEIRSMMSETAPDFIMSHLACADTPDHPASAQQLANFLAIKDEFPGVRASLSATAGIYLGEDYHFDLVRPGIGLYGGGPARPPGVRLKPALTLKAPILNLFEAEPGTPIGYGASYTTRAKSQIATVALGYADGYLRSAGNFGFGILDDTPCPIVGRVSMDLTIIDVSDCAAPPKIGDEVEFIGPKAGYEIQAEAAGTIGYELSSRLGGRITRAWVEQEPAS